MWFKKKKEKKPEPIYENAYSLLNKELERMHKLFQAQYDAGGSEKNLNAFWNKICELQQALLEALKNQPAHAEEIKDLQNTVAEILLLAQTESR
jgi:hypothetical protein